jgi:hypothetical protein
MAVLTNWLFGLAALLALAIFFFSGFNIARRLLARFALRLCQQRNAREEGFICDLRNRLHRFATKPLLPSTITMIGSLVVLVFLYIEHSPRL